MDGLRGLSQKNVKGVPLQGGPGSEVQESGVIALTS